MSPSTVRYQSSVSTVYRALNVDKSRGEEGLNRRIRSDEMWDHEDIGVGLAECRMVAIAAVAIRKRELARGQAGIGFGPSTAS